MAIAGKRRNELCASVTARTVPLLPLRTEYTRRARARMVCVCVHGAYIYIYIIWLTRFCVFRLIFDFVFLPSSFQPFCVRALLFSSVKKTTHKVVQITYIARIVEGKKSEKSVLHGQGQACRLTATHREITEFQARGECEKRGL